MRAIRTLRHGAPTWRGTRRICVGCAPFVPEVYLAVSLELERPSKLGAGLVRGMDRARRRVEELLGVGATPPIAAAEIEALIASEERAFLRAAGTLGGEASDDS